MKKLCTDSPLGPRIFTVLLLAFSFSGVDLIAQEAPGNIPLADRSFGGLFVGLGALPTGLTGGCSHYSVPTGRTASLLAGIVFGVPVGPFNLEARAHRWIEDTADDCFLLQTLFETGTHTQYTRSSDTAPKYASELSIGYPLPRPLPLAISVGGGWLWGTDVPYLTSVIGFRTRGKIQFTGDLAWNVYRFPLTQTEEVWQNLELESVLGEREDHLWRGGWSFQVGIARSFR